MTNPIADVLTEIQAEVLAVTPSFTFRKGRRELARNDTTPRVVWVLGGGTFDDPEHQSFNPRSVATEVITVEAHIFGATEDDAWAIKNNLHVAAYRMAYGSFLPLRFEWPEVDEHYASFGAYLVLTFALRVPVTDQIVPTVVLTGYAPNLSATVSGDGVLECGET